MKRPLFLGGCVITGAVFVLTAQPAQAERVQPPVPSVSDLEPVSNSASDLLAQSPAQAQVTQVTAVRLNPTPGGVEVILETAGEFPEVLTSSIENSLITDIPNAQLRLPKGEAFRQDNPTNAIASVIVSNLDAKSIRVTVTGRAGVPTVEVSQSPQALILSVAAPPVPAPQPTPAPIAPPVTPALPTEPQQPAPPEAPAPAPQAEEAPLELTVTAEEESGGYNVPNASAATRTDTPILDIPASIQVIPRQVIEDQAATDLNEALRNVSGVVTSSSSRDIFQNFTIRGFETGNTYLRNGIPDNDVGRLGFDFANVERLEVLKGPASVLFGQVTPGGTVNIVTKQPLSSPFYDVEASYGSFNTYQGAFDLSGPLNGSGTLLYRLNASAYGSDTFIDFIDIDRYLFAPVLTWLINDDTKLTLEAEYLDAQYPNERGLPLEGTIADNPNGEIPRSRYLGEPAFDRNDRRTLRIGYDFEHRFSENWKLRNVFRFLRENDNQDSVAPLGLLDDLRTQERVAFIQTGPSSQNNYETTANVVGSFETGSIKHQLLAGVDYSYEASTGSFEEREIGNIDIFEPVYNQPLGAVISTFDDKSRFETLGIYIQDQITFFENFILVLGGRYDSVKQEAEDLIAGTSTSQEDNAFSPRIGLIYKPIETVSLYGSFGQSFEQVIGTAFDNRLFEPQRGTQYEVGVKADLLDGRLSSTLALYNLTLSNVLTSDPRNPDFSVQTGKQRSRGVELDLAGNILPGWDIIAGYAYTDAEVTEDNDIPVGNQLINIPEHTFSVWTKYEIQSGSLQGLGFGLGLFYVGERTGDLENTFDLPSYLRTDAALYYRRNNFRAALNIKNLFNINYFETANGRNRIFPGAPIEVLGSVGWEF